MKLTLKKILITFVIFLGFFGSNFVFAQQPNGSVTDSPNGSITNSEPPRSSTRGTQESKTLESPFAFTTVKQLVDKLIDIIIKVGGVLARHPP